MTQRHLPNLAWIRSFEAAARLSSFTRAASALGLTQTAVSLHIKALEGSLGTLLFHRAPRRVHLTEVGEAYLAAVGRGLDEIAAATDQLFARPGRQTVTLRAPLSTVLLHLTDRVPHFMTAHPEVNLCLLSTIWAGTGGSDAADLELRIGPPGPGKRLSDEPILPVSRSGRAGPLISVMGFEDHWPRYLASRTQPALVDERSVTVDTTAAALSIAAAGGGVALALASHLRHAASLTQGLRAVGPPLDIGIGHDLLVAERTGSRKPAITLVADWLAEILAPVQDQ